MSAALEISIADRMRPAFADERALVQSIVDETNDAWANHGVAGAEIIGADFRDGAVFVHSKPGAQSLTVSAVSNFVKAVRARRKAAA